MSTITPRCKGCFADIRLIKCCVDGKRHTTKSLRETMTLKQLKRKHRDLLTKD